MGYYSSIETDGVQIEPPLTPELIKRFHEVPFDGLAYFLDLGEESEGVDRFEATYEPGKAYTFWDDFIGFVLEAMKAGHSFTGTVTRTGEEMFDADRVVLSGLQMAFEKPVITWEPCARKELH